MMGLAHRPACHYNAQQGPRPSVPSNLKCAFEEETFMAKHRMTAACAAVAAAFAVPAAQARINSIVVDSTTDIAATGAAPAYKRVIGRAFGSLDPMLPVNAIITDINLAPKMADGSVPYMATFQLVYPADGVTSGLMWHDVPNRGGRITISTDLRAGRDMGLSSGWQGENAGIDGAGGVAQVPGREWVQVPVAVNPDGSAIQGRVMGRILNASGFASQRMIVHSNQVPYLPVDMNSPEDTLTEIEHETIDGFTGATHLVPRADWSWGRCPSDPTAFPGTPDPRQICVRGGFHPNRAYQVVFRTQGPPVLGIGFAAFRDLASFFKNASVADGNLPAVAGKVNWVLGRGSSQSGNFLRAYLHLGFNEDESGRRVQDGTWPMIAGRRVSLNTRFAMPDGVLKLYEPGSEGPQWWQKHPDNVRGMPPGGILDRCVKSETCPKIIEHFGAAEIWGLKLGPEWVGTDPKQDIPLPDNVRRYYISSTPHGGGNGGFSTNPGTVGNCPSTGYGVGTFPSNPMPHTETTNAIAQHFRHWLMDGTLPPPSQWPRLKGPRGERTLVEPTKAAMGFPTIPYAGMTATAPTGLINPVLDYDFGPRFDNFDASGIVDNVPPIVKQAIPMMVPKVDADGNELGGVPVVLREAPLGTYLGWNITNGGFHDDKICHYLGGWIPFAKTQAERLASGDPRLSLQERYGNHAGYVAAVRAGIDKAMAAGFLLQADADRLLVEAEASNVLNP